MARSHHRPRKWQQPFIDQQKPLISHLSFSPFFPIIYPPRLHFLSRAFPWLIKSYLTT
ncbi:cyclin-dependent kinase 1 [Fusarium oxysporum f. sp. conglutinans race 2 54008]|uniref:Uncharacterized protein n=2 Tax=Fusarium oxysporum TaxID=5507 RepID=W9Z4I2_FUSOX|nr:hypothetical protein FOMG_19717 [Fusarium oxysporum f. sp. melonis 26406]EXL65740.1 cyclin-dependent kinase 1 [Fusarium oxysporum f. sp. conglutinans race 2 54008]EXK23507.1 hypothetical protein FOMG_19717 [Fusarium oxysporum f. sp. melonis 26406]EXK23508.1 hypothetical protein FOMG_19717 [Fusarium oxysporum f. sp. melonis 26406]EXK23509.1 hypothetical protein FOMG_19717 [Fusarium oxysporum f. sp. melonis 26406]